MASRLILQSMSAVLFGCHACDTLKIPIERGGLGESKQIGCFLKRLCGTRLDELLGLYHYVLLYPFNRRQSVGSRADHFAEVLGGNVQ